jgi:hypothetical protein
MIILCTYVRLSSFFHTPSIPTTIQIFSYDFSPDYIPHHILSLRRPRPNFAAHPYTSAVISSVTMVENRHEPETYADLEALPEYEATRDIFKQAGWEPFLKKFDGYNDAITLQFSLHFEGGFAKVGELEFEVTEKFVSEAIQLPTTGQRWTKGQPVDKQLCTQLLKPQYRETQWSEGTSRSWLEPQWAQLLAILQRYLTCEG